LQRPCCSVMRDVGESAVTANVYNTYSRRELYDVRTLAACQLTRDLIERVRQLGLCAVDRLQRHGRFGFTHYRGRRSGQRQRPVPSLRAVGNGVSIITGNRRQRSADVSPAADRRSSTSTRVPTLIRRKEYTYTEHPCMERIAFTLRE